ncbi:MAG: hypothetical protein RR744_00115 [Cellulosilyticaceae bacterium]
MIIDYKLNSKSRPSEREVWLMSSRAQKDGHKVTMAMLRAMETGELKYSEGVFYKLCRHCVDYLPIDNFYTNKRYVMDAGYICKTCTATRRRIKAYAMPTYVTDSKMSEPVSNIVLNIDNINKEIIIKKLVENGYS